MLFKQMRYFVSVVDNQSFTEAAVEEFISQSAISQQIRALEEELGVDLLVRQHRSFSLTPAGQHFYHESQHLLTQIDRVLKETRTIGEDPETQLRVGYLRVYGGQELHQAIAEFNQIYPEIVINIINGTHEELYQELRQNTVDIVLSDQRRMFSEDYVNFELVQPKTFVEISARNPLSQQGTIEMKDLVRLPCILITSKEQQMHEENFYRDILGFNGKFLFAENLAEGRLMVAGNQGFLPIESVGTLTPAEIAIKRIPLEKNHQAVIRNYCAFWKKERTNYYIEEFALILKNLIIDREEVF